MKKKVLSITIIAAILMSMLTIGVFSVSAAEGKIVKNRVTFTLTDTGTDDLPSSTDKAAYIAGKKTEFENYISRFAGAGDDVDDYSSFFTDNTYAVAEGFGWGGLTIEESDDAIVIGDTDDWESLYVVSGWIAKVTTYIVKYKLVTINEGPAQTAKIGDANSDGNVDVLDAAAIQKHAAGNADLTAEQLYVADVNNDNAVDVLDAAEIQKFSTGKITEFKKKA